jgi:hypothetical protein
MANTSSRSGISRNRRRITIENELALIEDVRARAYVLYESRGREDGHDLDDWLLAEQQAIRHSAQSRASKQH